MARTSKPTDLTLRAYQVGFGDCFLLTFHYREKERHVLIDFGNFGQLPGKDRALLHHIAENIKERCGGKLDAVVATHRHQDHISGFSTNKHGTGTGDIIASCNPEVVIQPWTEAPDADPKTGHLGGAAPGLKSFMSTLRSMHAISRLTLKEVEKREETLNRTLKRELRVLGGDNIKNASAVKNLMTMGKRQVYVHFGSPSGLEAILPGVKVRVLGPPSLEQSEEIRKMRREDEAEFWHFQSSAAKFVTNENPHLFQGAKTCSTEDAPPPTRWFIKKMQSLRGQQMLGIMRALDKAMNNTSIILLFQVGDKKLLFPGDAQIENWSYALKQAPIRRLLKSVNLYKVGHHGSLNATPKTLWNLFERRSKDRRRRGRLQTVISTKPNVHGKAVNESEVPRKPLVKALKENSIYITTEKLKPELDRGTPVNFYRDIPIQL